MLVLTRKRSESIRVGNDIVIKVIHTSRGTVKLGIEAPPHVRVLRGELAEFAATTDTEIDDDSDTHELDTIDAVVKSDEEASMHFDMQDALDVETLMECVGAH